MIRRRTSDQRSTRLTRWDNNPAKEDLKRFSHTTMACLRLLGVLLALECIAAKYVLPNDPLFNSRDIPRDEFGDRETFPFDNLDTHISDQTPLVEIKRMLETLDQVPVHSPVSDDPHGPIAWYEPQQDEPLFDDGKCADSFRSCQRFVDNGQCWEDKFKGWMKSRCKKSCEYCKVNCWETKYGCCPDGKTAADGPAKMGCGVKLCVDLRVCDKVKDECDNASISTQRKAWLKNYCAYTCRLCKAPNPKADCEARKPLYGCCWNGDEATGYNGQGCVPCEDFHVRACKLFGECDSPFYHVRKFAEQRCPQTCGRCGVCTDKQVTAKCEQWERQGLCTSSAGWKQYLEENCAKTCRFCGSSGNVGVRSLLGL
ncbi:hypothetical protein ACROYT_G008665 [Oculina patagonica]